MGRRMVRTMLVSGVLFVAGIFVATWLIARRGPTGMTPSISIVSLGVPLIGLLMMVPIFLYERSTVARFVIENNSLVLGGKRYPLQGMAEVARDPKIMCRAIKIFGNGGLGAIRGRFWSKRVGRFQASLTDTECAVVLRWPDRVIAVSPADPEFFITCVKSAAGIR
jgi:Bacterial PH domain